MRQTRFAIAALVLAAMLTAIPAVAATKTYQVTGPVLEVNDTMIAVQKGKDRWEIARDASTKVTGDLKVGSKVTIEYRMIATTVDAKAAPAKKAK
ncbi:MAG TPA: hypothetical protein VGG65_01280 [Thermoanaerobaculia bacterium]|jgi:hypothetical protein